ncbi:hypothetical protein [Bartonella sp. DGB1]|uniref:hypothetical protein n=1 Tax=Bartonella sp. DGB1 TaxID=3239807 RepID=UPI00352453EC
MPEVKLPSFEPINKVANNYTKEEIEQYAEKLREELGLGLGPISNVMGLLEQMGIFICHLALEKENIDAFFLIGVEIVLLFFWLRIKKVPFAEDLTQPMN